MGDMKQAFRMADGAFNNKLSAGKVVQVMCSVLGMEPIDARRVLVSSFGSDTRDVTFEQFVALCEVQTKKKEKEEENVTFVCVVNLVN